MAKKVECRECGEKIDHLINTQDVVLQWEARIDDKTGNLVFPQKLDEWAAPADNSTYACPECELILFEDYLSAKQFLSGETVEVQS